MKIVIGLLVLIGIANIILALRGRKDVDQILEKSEKRSTKQVARTLRDVERTTERVKRYERDGLTDTKDHKRLETLNGRLEVMKGNPLASVEKSRPSTALPLKRF
jgi:hypothetical protein